MRTLRHGLLAFAILAIGGTAQAQITLTGTSYSQDFATLASGLPTGWSVTTSATISTLGTSATFTSATTSWATTTLGSDFRNISSDNIAWTTTGATQAANTDRAFGWRPVGSNAGEVTPGRTGAVTLAISNTTGLTEFNLSLNLFTANNVSGSQTYELEYRVGGSGNFTSLGTYTTPSATGNTDYQNLTTMTANSITLSALNNQASTVYLRLRGTSSAGSANLDTIGLDNFSLTYSAIPEPSAYAALLGAVALVGVMIRRRKPAAMKSA